MKNVIKFLPEDCVDNMYFNHEIHLILENLFYELETGYRVWDWHGSKDKLIPMVNFVLKKIVQYFV